MQHSSGNPSYRNQRRKRNKRNPDQKRSKALTVCRQHDAIHRNPKDTIRKLLELISQFNIFKLYRNHLHSYTRTMKNQKKKLHFHYGNKKNKVFMNKPT